MTEQVPLTGQGSLKEGGVGALGGEWGCSFGLAHELRKNPKYSATSSSTLLSGWVLPKLRPLGPTSPPAHCKRRKYRKKHKTTQNTHRPQNTELYMRRQLGRRKQGGVLVYMSTEKHNMKTSLRFEQDNRRHCNSAFPFGAHRSSW